MLEKTIRIGFCDSGVGGLILAFDFLKYVAPILAGANKRYGVKFEFYHICEGFPYGLKSDEEIIVTGSKMIHKLQRKIGCNVLVVACNTLSAKLDLYNIHFEAYGHSNFKIVPIVANSSEGIYKKALENSITNNTKNIEIMMLATPAAFRNNIHDKYIRYAHHKAKSKQGLIIKSFTPDIFWQQNVENGTAFNEDNIQNIKQNIKSFLVDGYFEKLNAIGLFCTHYPAYQSIISDAVDNSINIVSQGDLIAKSVIDTIIEMFPEYEFNQTDDTQDLSFVSVYSLYKNDEYSSTIQTIINDIFGEKISKMLKILN